MDRGASTWKALRSGTSSMPRIGRACLKCGVRTEKGHLGRRKVVPQADEATLPVFSIRCGHTWRKLCRNHEMLEHGLIPRVETLLIDSEYPYYPRNVFVAVLPRAPPPITRLCKNTQQLMVIADWCSAWRDTCSTLVTCAISVTRVIFIQVPSL